MVYPKKHEPYVSASIKLFSNKRFLLGPIPQINKPIALF